MSKLIALLILGVCTTAALGQGSPSQLSMPTLTEDKQRRQFAGTSDPPNKLSINSVTGSNRVDNPAILQLKGDRAAFPFLSTLPNQGSAIYITTLKPCGLVLPHVHPRATEQYLIISGQMDTGLAEESSGLSNITATLTPGQSFVAPQGLLHYNANRNCTPLVFLQIFDSTDPGSVVITNSLAALARVDPQSLAAANAANITASPYGAVNLDSSCLASCGLASSGAGLEGLPAALQPLLGLSSAPGTAPSNPPVASG